MINELFRWVFFTICPAILDIFVAIAILKWKFSPMIAVVLSLVMVTYGTYHLFITPERLAN